MKFDIHQPPREFSPGAGIKLKDMGDLDLGIDEQVTVRLAPDRGNDVVRKPWGFYLTNSLNGTLQAQGIKTALVENRQSRRTYVMLVAKEKVAEFNTYLAEYGMHLVRWLDEWQGS
jgi:hypothetical protein